MFLIKRFKERLLPFVTQGDDALAYWREWILFAILSCGAVLSSVVLLSVIALVVKEGPWFLAAIDAAVLVGLVYLLFSRKLSYRCRAGGTLLIIYVVSLGVLTNAGIVSGGPAWLFGFSVIAGLLLGFKAACVAIIINMVTLSVFGYLISHEVIGAQFQFFVSSERALAAFFNFTMPNIAASISAAVMLKGLERTNRKQKDVAAQLRREAEELQRIRALLEAAINQSPSGIIIADAPDVRIYLANPAAFGIRGGLPDGLIDIDLEKHVARWQLRHPDGTPYDANDLPLSKAVLKGETSRDVEMLMRNESGLEHWVSTNAAPIVDSRGGVMAGIVVFHDITERKRAEEALKKSESRLKSTFRAAPVGLAIVKDRTFIAVNESFCKVLGYGEDDLLGRTTRILCENEAGNTRIGVELYDHLWHQDFAYAEMRNVRRDGVVRDVVLRTAPISSLDPSEGLVIAIEDVTKQKRTEKVLRESEEKFRTTFQGSPDAITITRMKDGRFIEVNDGFTKMTGYTKKEVIGKTFSELKLLVSPRNRVNIERKLKQEGEVEGYEIQYRSKNGAVMDTLLAVRPLVYANEDCLVAVVKDISQIKRTAREKAKLEKQLQHAQKMESMGTLAGGVAHDFNNLLMGIQGRVSLMLMDKHASHPDFEHLKGIEEYVQNAATLTRQLLGFARGGKYEVKPSDINELIRKSAEMFGRTRKEITFHAKYHADIWTVAVDRGQVRQVLMNLFVNAWQAMPGGGTLFLETDNVVLGEENLQPFPLVPGKYVKISITDTGMGMDKSTQKKIFDPFFTTKEMGRGTGLGLASAYGIIKNHGGIINVYSEKGEGATFNIYLPVSESDVVDSKSGLSLGIRRGSETLLLVDDEQMIIETARELLTALGYEVFTAKGGKEAVSLYKEKKDLIDVVILDMIMPDMSGGDTFDRLKSVNPGVKVILASGYSINGHAGDIMNRGCDAFIQKPFNMMQLSEKLSEVLHQ